MLGNKKPGHVRSLQLQQPYLAGYAAAVAGEAAVCSHHPVAGNHQRDGIMPHRAGIRFYCFIYSARLDATRTGAAFGAV